MRKERGAIVVILLPSKNEFINYLMEINTIPLQFSCLFWEGK